MKDAGETSYVFRIKIYRDRLRKLLSLSQSTYINKVLKKFSMQKSKREFLLMTRGINLSKAQYLKT